MSEQLTSEVIEIAHEWIGIISDPVILLPVVGGIVCGLLVSLSPWVSSLKRQSDRAFYTYLTNATVSGLLFILTNLDHNLEAVLSMLILVMSVSVAFPWIYFNIWRKK